MRLSGRTVAIKSIPTDLPASEAAIFLPRYSIRSSSKNAARAKATFRDDIAASLACKAAVKINMKLTPEKMQWLIDRLLLTLADDVPARPARNPAAVDEGHRTGFHRT